MNKKYTQAPLPFQGQKRNYLKRFRKELVNYSSDATYVDLFGGSGLLSHTVKQFYPNARVIYNDFDNYSKRLKNINKTNKILEDLRVILADCERKKKLPEAVKNKVVDRLAKERGFVDWRTLSGNILFSMNYVYSLDDLKKETLYNRVRKSNYSAVDYLLDVECVRSDYKILFEQYKGLDNVVFLVDPPYLSTDTGSYTDCWKLGDYLDVLTILKEARYFYFTSSKSHIVELCNWFGEHSDYENPFEGGQTVSMDASVTYNSKYQDIMISK